MGRSTGCADENGLLPTRGRPAGLGIGGPGRGPGVTPGWPGGWAGADGAPVEAPRAGRALRRPQLRGPGPRGPALRGARRAWPARWWPHRCRPPCRGLCRGIHPERCRATSAGALGGDFGGRRLAATKRLTQPASHRSLYRRRRGFNEFALFIQPGEHIFTADTEFLSQLVYAGLTCHYISCLGGDGSGPRLGFSYDAWSSGLHGVLMFFATCPVAGQIGRTENLDVLDHRGCVR